MARNQTFDVADEAENIVYMDWVELHNSSSSAVSLNGYSLSDDRARPLKFAFPVGTVLGPEEYLIVFFFNEGNCRTACAGLEPCLALCKPPVGLVASFNLAALGETVFLFRNNGTVPVDQVGVRNQQADTSNGRDPVTGTYGVIYLPTPRSENKPINLKPHTVSLNVISATDETEEAIVTIEIDRDVDAPGDLEVSLQWGDVGDCGDVPDEESLVVAEVRRVVLSGGDPVTTEIRLDASNNPVPMDRVTLTYEALLPPAACGMRRAVRFTATDDLSTVLMDNTCTRYCIGLQTVVVNEYLPRNTRDEFYYRNSAGEVVVPPTSQDYADWIEIYNYGTESVDMTRLSLVTEREREAGIFDTWLFGRDGQQTVDLPVGGYLLVLADGDGGSFRRPYYRPDQPEHFFYSTHFRLDPDKPTIDEFSLYDSSLGQEIDRVVLDFSAMGGTIGNNITVGRLEGEDPESGHLIPGSILPCSTPEAQNTKSCDACGPNTLATLFQGTFHDVFLSSPPRTERNACIPDGTDFDLNAVFSVDEDLFPKDENDQPIDLETAFVSASFLVDRGQGEEEVPVTQFLRVSKTLVGYQHVRLKEPLAPLSGPVLHYRVQVTDVCDRVFDLGPFSVGTTAGEHPQIAINEINRSHAVPGDDSGRAWIELFNRSQEEVSLAGMFISNDASAPRKAPLPAGARIPPGGFVVVLTDAGGTIPPHVNVDLDWPAESGSLFLLDAIERGTCLLDSVEFEGLSAGASFGRVPDGGGDLDLLATPSPGSPNAEPLTFVRGDVDSDLRITVLDAIRLIGILFQGDPRRPPCEFALDANGDGDINITDPIFLLDFLLGVVPTIPPPFPEPGPCVSN